MGGAVLNPVWTRSYLDSGIATPKQLSVTLVLSNRPYIRTAGPTTLFHFFDLLHASFHQLAWKFHGSKFSSIETNSNPWKLPRESVEVDYFHGSFHGNRLRRFSSSMEIS